MCKPCLRTSVNLVPGLYTARFTLGYFVSRFQRDEGVCGRGGKSCAGTPGRSQVSHGSPPLRSGYCPGSLQRDEPRRASLGIVGALP